MTMNIVSFLSSLVTWITLIQSHTYVNSMKEVSLYKHPLRMPCRFPVKRQTYVRDPLDCSIFYTCYGNRYWKMACSTPHTIWSLKYKVCVWQNTAFDDCNYVNTKTTAPPINLKQRDHQKSNDIKSKHEPWEKTSRHWVTWKTGSTRQPYTPFVPFTTTTHKPKPYPSSSPKTTTIPIKPKTTNRPLFVWERKTLQPRFTWRPNRKHTIQPINLKPITRKPFTWTPLTTPKLVTTKRPPTKVKTTKPTPRSSTARPPTRPTTIRPTRRTTSSIPRATNRPTTKSTIRQTHTEATPTKPRSIFTWDTNIWKQRTWKPITRKPIPTTTRRPFWNIITKRPILWLPRNTLIPQSKKLGLTQKPTTSTRKPNKPKTTRSTTMAPIFWRRITKRPLVKSPFTQKPVVSTPIPSLTPKPSTTTTKPSTMRSTTIRPSTAITTRPTTRRMITWLPRITWRPVIKKSTTSTPSADSTTTAVTTTLAVTRDITYPQKTEWDTEWSFPPTSLTSESTDTTGTDLSTDVTTPQIISNDRNSDKCGIMPTPLIIGGKPSAPGRWPWQVSLQIIAAIEPWHRCGGVLIHPSWVLTAAHCVEGPFYGDLRNWRIVLAEDNLNEGSGREVYRKISRIVAHPGYIRTSNFPNDVALLQMDEPVDTSTGESRVACLPDLHAEIPPNANCWLSGWGETRGTGGNENSMNELQVEILPNWLCSSMWRRVGIHVLDDQVCVGYGDTGACYGDSGGPLMCELDGRYYVTGVMSWLINNCSARGFPNVFTRVTSYTDWIYEKLEYYDWWH